MGPESTSGTVLCLADGRDHSLEWLRSSVADLVVVTADEIGTAAGFTLQQQWPAAGRPAPSEAGLRLHGTDIDMSTISAIYCRLALVNVDHLGFEPVDATYASAEWNALMIGWLHVLGDRVVNRPLPHGLSGRWAALDTWAVLAHSVGLDAVTKPDDGAPPVMRMHDDVVVVGDRVFSERRLRPEHVDGCRALAQAVGSRIIGFSATSGWDRGPLVDLAGNPCPVLADLPPSGQVAIRSVLSGTPISNSSTTSTRTSAA